MKICIVSDSHDRADPLLEAVRSARLCGARAVIHCGDVIGTHTLRPLLAAGLPLHVVHGNNVGDVFAMQRLAAQSQGLVTYHGDEADLSLAGRRIFVTHMPHLAHAMACTGEFQLVCCGHAHAPSVAQQPNIAGSRTWLVNPGTVAGIGDAPATWILADLQTMAFEVHGDE